MHLVAFLVFRISFSLFKKKLREKENGLWSGVSTHRVQPPPSLWRLRVILYDFQFAVRWLSHIMNGIYEPRLASATPWTKPIWSVYQNRQPFIKSRPGNGRCWRNDLLFAHFHEILARYNKANLIVIMRSDQYSNRLLDQTRMQEAHKDTFQLCRSISLVD